MAVKIVTDSTCDLPPSVIERYGITVVPLYINVGDESYLDGVDISRQDFYQRLPGWSTPPKTAAPGSEVFAKTYEQLVEEGASEILSIHISPTLSSTLEVAQVGAGQVSSASVTALDSRQLSLGGGFVVLEAAKAAAAGKSVDEILEILKELIPRVHVFAALDTMEYLRRSGRVNGLIAGIGNLLRVKPLLKMHDGVATSERVRTLGRAYQRLIELAREAGPLEQLALVHTNAADRAATLWERVKHLVPSIADPLSVNVTPVLGSHLGPGAVGFACVAAPKS